MFYHIYEGNQSSNKAQCLRFKISTLLMNAAWFVMHVSVLEDLGQVSLFLQWLENNRFAPSEALLFKS